MQIYIFINASKGNGIKLEITNYKVYHALDILYSCAYYMHSVHFYMFKFFINA